MSEFLEDPSVLTKDKLKSELLANNVSLPSGEHRKDVYVQLYLKTLTVQNKKRGSPDTFSSDEELPPPVVSNKSRSGRKATRKTDKPPADEVDVADLTDESLKDQLLKYGVRIGPIVASTRKLYEKKLQKLMEQGPPESAPPPTMPVKIGSNQNGNTDSDQYSDKEEEERAVPEPEPDPEPEPEPEPVPVVEKPVRSRGKTPQRTRRQEYNRGLEEPAEDHSVLTVKRKQRRSSLQLDLRVPVRNNADMPVVPASKPVTPALQEIGAELLKRKSVALADPVLMKGASQEPGSLLVSRPSKPWTEIESEDLCSASPPFAHIASSRRMKRPSSHLPAQVDTLSPVLTQENLTFLLQPLCQQDVPDIPSPKPVTSAQQSVNVPRQAVADPVVLERVLPEPESLLGAEPSDARLSAKLEGMDLSSPSPFAPILSNRGAQVWPSLHQQTLVDPSSTVVTQVEERVTASEKVSGVGEKDLLKELFPNEPGTPTGISATCRRPIRGAAGRPLPASDFWLNESRRRHSERIETSTYITETRTPARAAALHLTSTAPFSSSSSSAGVPSTSPALQRRSLPMWLQLLLLSVVAGFLFFVYQAMETNQASPFVGSKNLEGGGQ